MCGADEAVSGVGTFHLKQLPPRTDVHMHGMVFIGSLPVELFTSATIHNSMRAVTI